jgi:tRNA-(ms[2]io[6]A)-hydroxylase
MAWSKARSCERFSRLIEVLDEELASFYASLLKSEARHFQVYLDYATQMAEGNIDDRVQMFLEMDRELIQSPDPEFRFHSGVPAAV